ncbi:unnamed protein product [Xylocopa violacea]|uniref:Uncharacterized protein n=1 Tax=Xylocopa violacea TaxID=135666 RepID=A0ABP1NKL3_XYLVO
MHVAIDTKKEKNGVHRSRRSSRATGPNVRASPKRVFDLRHPLSRPYQPSFVHTHPQPGDSTRLLINRANDEIESENALQIRINREE